MIRLILTFLVLSILQSCSTQKVVAKKSISGLDKIVLKEEGPEEFFFWEMDNQESLWNFELGPVPAIEAYKDSLKLALGDNKYEEAVKKESIQNLDPSLLEKVENGDRINALLVHTGSLGKIRAINYLEAQILNYQVSKYPLFSQPTEFHCFILSHPEKGKLRVYIGASNTEWPPHPTVIIDAVEQEQEKGWKLTGHLHNHYCKKDKDYVGILAPSMSDAQYYKMLKERFGVEKTFITNGMHTVEIEAKDFEQFESY